MKTLHAEDAERPTALADMIAASPIAAVVSNPRLADNPIIDCNQAFVALTGYSRDEVIGRNCRFLTGPATERELTAQLGSGIAARRPVMVEILNYKKDGTPFRNAVMVAPIFGPNGDLEYFLGSQVEVAQANAAGDGARRMEAEKRLEALTSRQRETLVRMASGKANKQIAFELNISERTVKMHVAAVLLALNARTRADAIRLAVEAGL